MSIVLDTVPHAYLHMKAPPTEPFKAISIVPMKDNIAVKAIRGISREGLILNSLISSTTSFDVDVFPPFFNFSL
jgi:hypothetical protein